MFVRVGMCYEQLWKYKSVHVMLICYVICFVDLFFWFVVDLLSFFTFHNLTSDISAIVDIVLYKKINILELK